MSGALLGATLRACGGEEAAAVVAGLTGAGGVDLRGTRPLLLAHCHGGVVWGHAREDGWALSGAADAFPEASPPLAYEQIEELRLFTEVEELHLWRIESGLRGRWLADAPDGTAQDWARPIDTQRVLLGDRRVSGPRGGFTLVRDAAGRRHAVPLECDEEDFQGGRPVLRLLLRQYLAQDAGTGAVRIGATRLIGLARSGR